MTQDFDVKNVKKNKLKIKLKGINEITNMRGMFYECNSLESLPDISEWNPDNLINISYLFYGCSSLVSIPDISKWNTSNVTDIRCMFYECKLLKSIPDI